MITRLFYCEDCREEVIVFGDYEIDTPNFIELDRDGHPEEHDLSGPIGAS